MRRRGRQVYGKVSDKFIDRKTFTETGCAPGAQGTLPRPTPLNGVTERENPPQPTGPFPDGESSWEQDAHSQLVNELVFPPCPDRSNPHQTIASSYTYTPQVPV